MVISVANEVTCIRWFGIGVYGSVGVFSRVNYSGLARRYTVVFLSWLNKSLIAVLINVVRVQAISVFVNLSCFSLLYTAILCCKSCGLTVNEEGLLNVQKTII